MLILRPAVRAGRTRNHCGRFRTRLRDSSFQTDYDNIEHLKRQFRDQLEKILERSDSGYRRFLSKMLEDTVPILTTLGENAADGSLQFHSMLGSKPHPDPPHCLPKLLSHLRESRPNQHGFRHVGQRSSLIASSCVAPILNWRCDRRRFGLHSFASTPTRLDCQSC